MELFRQHRLALLLAGIIPLGSLGATLQNLSLTELEQRLSDIDTELSQLAQYSPRSGSISLGYRSENHRNPNITEWVQLDLGQENPIDQIVLVPSIWRDTLTGFSADGFPVQFEIRTGTQPDSPGILVARFDESDQLLPRIAPLIVPCPATTASWIRVEATLLSKRAFDDKFDLKLSEILAFNGTENVALNRPAITSHTRNPEQRERKTRFLTDGFMPYLMDAAQGEQSIAVICDGSDGNEATITIDLEKPYLLNRIHLHAVDPSDIQPLAFTGDHGIPGLLRIEGANQPDFSDATVLLNNRHRNAYDAGPILMRPIPETTCRYIRLTQIQPYIDQAYGLKRSQMGFAEIELFSEGRNVALNKRVDVNFKQKNPARASSALTDGRNFYGNILPLRIWMEQLALRHDLETERPLVMDELNRRYARQKINLRRMSWIAALLVAVVIFTILIDRLLRQRHITDIRERFAADLHDELGANIHTIGLLGDLAREAESHDELLELLDRSRVFTERSGAAVRHCTNMLEASGLCEDIVEDMKRSSDRLLADLDHTLHFEGEERLASLKPRKRIDLFFFYKECLNNILRHSGATQVTTHLAADQKKLTLTITDNGIGQQEIPGSLKRRARILKAYLTIQTPPEGGTAIELKL